MNTQTFSNTPGSSEFNTRLTNTLGYIRLARAEYSSSRSEYKDYTHIYNDPDFHSRFGSDNAFTVRCGDVAVELFDVLRSEIRGMQRLPESSMTKTQWDWFECAWAIVISVETMGWPTEVACTREVVQLCVLARKMLELQIGTDLGRRKTLFLATYIEEGLGKEADGGLLPAQAGSASRAPSSPLIVPSGPITFWAATISLNSYLQVIHYRLSVEITKRR